jgi:hypothetical protein
MHMQRPIWVAGIALTNAAAAWLVATWVVSGAAGEGYGILVPCAPVATLALSFGGLWWGTRGRTRVRTGVGIGLAIGVLVHPLMWYLALLVAFGSGTRSSLADPVLTPVEGLGAAWIYASVSLLFTGWLSCLISAVICGVGLLLYARRPSV